MKFFDFLFGWQKNKLPEFNEADLPANKELNKKRDINQLLGICEGAISGGAINSNQKTYIKNWILTHNLKDDFPANKILEKINALPEADFVNFIKNEIIGRVVVTYEKKEKLETLPIEIDYDCPDNIIFKNKNFILTGKFTLIDRKNVEQFIVSKGGCVKDRVSGSINYLIVGSVSSRDWKHTGFGNKIQEALKQKERRPIQIIHEKWYIEKIHGQ